MSLYSLHLEHLKKGGLSEETVREAGIYSVRPGDISKIFNHPKIESMLAFPYPGTDHVRYKLFSSEPILDKDGHQIKYYQPKGSSNRLYISERVRAILSDPSILLHITEGEKKTLKMNQEGLHCVGLGGLWSWTDGSEEKNLIPDFDLFEWKGRVVYLDPDNDWLKPDRHGEKKNLREAVYELAYRLIDRGAKPFVNHLPQGTEKGIDDYLCNHTVDEYKALKKEPIRKYSIDEMIESLTPQSFEDNRKELLTKVHQLPPTLQDTKIKKISEKAKIGVRGIRKELKAIDSKQENGVKLTPKAYFPELVDLCLDQDGNVSFLIKQDDSVFVAKTYEVGGVSYKPPDKKKMPFEILSAEKILNFINTDNDQKLFNDLFCTLKRFSYVPDRYFVILTLFVFLTYIPDHPEIIYFPMILFWAVPERGKSKAGKSVTWCAYRGIIVSSMREANIFRYSQDHHATIFFDMMDLWEAVEKTGAKDIFLQRHEKGAKVSRVIYPEKGPFEDMVWYDIYGPTIIATNEPVHNILDSRCIAIQMENRTDLEFEEPTVEKFLEMRERLTAWKVRIMDKPLPQAKGIISAKLGRFWNISKPLIQVCQMICPDQLGVLKDALLEIAGARVEDKQGTPEGEIISAMIDLSPKDAIEWSISIQDIADKINKHRPDDKKTTPRKVGQRLKALGLKKRQVHGYYEVMLTDGVLNSLSVEYGFKLNIDPVLVERHLSHPMSPNSINSNTYEGDVQGDVQTMSPNVTHPMSPTQGQLFQEVKEMGDVGDVLQGTPDNLISNLKDGEI